MIEKSSFIIGGMICGLCPIIIENSIKNVNGILEINVNYVAERCVVTYDNEKVSIEGIKNKVKDSGYECYEKEEFKKLKTRSESEKLKKTLIWAFILVSPMILLMLCNGGADCCVRFPAIGNSKFSNFIELLGYRLNFLRDWKLQIVIATPMQFIIGRTFYKRAYSSIKSKMLNMDVLVVLGTTITYLYSVYISFFGFTNASGYKSLYFESSMFVITLVLFGRYLEEKTKGQTSKAIKSLISIQAKTAHVEVNGIEKDINIEEVMVHDILVVKPGEKIPVDGKIIYGNTTIDESMFTGESIPVNKKIGDSVIGGSINQSGMFKFEALKVGNETKISEIIRLVEDAQNSRAAIQKLVDKVCGVFVPLILFISIITFIIWYFIIFNHVEYFMPKALLYAVSVLVVSCPCALGLATPTAITSGIGACAKDGILIKNSNVLEKVCSLNTIVLDKTGTITNGKVEVEDFIFTDCENKKEKEKILLLIGIAERNSEHSIGQSIYREINQRGIIRTENPKYFKYEVGKGIRALYKTDEILIGNRKFLNEHKVNNIDSVKIRMIERMIEESKKTNVLVSINKEIKVIIILSDKVRETSREAIERLKSRNLEVIMLTGDSKMAGERVAKEVGIEKVIFNVLPQQKGEVIEKLKGDGKCVAMVGDGINDAIALPKSDVGFSMGSGTDIAIESGDIVLLSNNLNAIVKAIDMSKKIRRKIAQNLFFAFIYNIVLIPLAASGHLTPAMACVSMSMSSLSVLINSLSIKKKYKFQEKYSKRFYKKSLKRDNKVKEDSLVALR